MPKHSKRYSETLKLVDRSQNYSLEDGIKMVKQLATAKFDETIELHFRLGIDPRHSDQQIRSTVMLPHGLGKSVRVLVFAEGEDARAAEAAGADIIADDAIIERIQKEGYVDYEAALAVPGMMAKVGRLGRVLGPRGLMPNPRAGTVVQPEDLGRAIEELKAGRLEFRNDKTGNLHIPFGKASFDEARLLENANTIIDTVIRLKPSGAKGIYMRRVVITPSMGPGIRLAISGG